MALAVSIALHIQNEVIFLQRKLFISKVNNRETIAAIKLNNGTCCLKKRIGNFPLTSITMKKIALQKSADFNVNPQI